MDNRITVSSATGVDVNLRVAGPGARSYAFIVDWHIRVLLALAWFLLVSLLLFGGLQYQSAANQGFDQYMMVALAPAGAIYVFYHIVLEILMQGRTPGKRVAGVRVVTRDGRTPDILAHLIRNVLRLLDSLPTLYTVGLISTIFTRNSVRIGDLAAGTVLVYETGKRAASKARPDIPAAAVGRYGLEKAELAWDLLERWDSLNETVREGLASTLLSQLRPDLQPGSDARSLKQQLKSLLEQPA